MNYIPEVSKMLGVEMGEKFNIRSKDGANIGCNPYYFTDTDLIDCNGNSSVDELHCLLSGHADIVKLPFEPKEGELYWYINSYKHIISYYWDGDVTDCMCKYCGNCFRTKEEAVAHKYDILEKLGVER